MGITTSIDITPNQRRIILSLLNRHIPGVTVWTYGSRLKWTSRPESDLDLIAFSAPEQLCRILELKEAFEESSLPFRVDVLVWDEVPDDFRQNILENYVVLVEKPGAKSESQESGMRFETTSHKLSEIISLIGGGTPKRSNSNFWGGNIPWLSVADFNNNEERFVDSASESITQEGLEKSSSKLLEPGQLIISARGTVGALAQLTKTMAFNQSCYGIDGKRQFVENDFLYYLVKHKVDELKTKTHGAVFDTIIRETFNYINVEIPSKKTQRIIAKILGDIDKKIKLNRQINQTLEQMAQAIFKSWFVDFEPVKAKMKAKEELRSKNNELKRKKSNFSIHNSEFIIRSAMRAVSSKTDAELEQLPTKQYKQLASTAALFPDELVESELGLIPKGWEVATLGEITSELRRGLSPKYTEEGGVQVINQKCIRNHTVDFTPCRRNDTERRKIVGRELQVGDVLVNSTGVGTLGRLAPVRYLQETTVADSHVTVIRGIVGEVTPTFLAGFMFSKETFIESSGAGSTGQTELRRQVLEEINVCKPSYQVQEEFEKMIRPPQELIAQNEQQKFCLSDIRDFLLPKFLSGEIDLKGAAFHLKRDKQPAKAMS